MSSCAEPSPTSKQFVHDGRLIGVSERVSGAGGRDPTVLCRAVRTIVTSPAFTRTWVSCGV